MKLIFSSMIASQDSHYPLIWIFYPHKSNNNLNNKIQERSPNHL